MGTSRTALVLVLLLAALLRLLWIDAGPFGVDQARDLAWAEAIARGDELPLIGPLMRGRVHLGATYYYFWSLPALLGAGPRGTYAFAALLGVAAVAATWSLARGIAGERAGLLAALALATTPAAVIDARIAWAPAAIPPATAAVLLGCRALLRRPTAARAAATAALGALATQLHLATVPLLAVAAGCVLARARPLGVRGLAAAGLAALLPLAPMALAWQLEGGSAGPAAGDVRTAAAAVGGTAAPRLAERPDPRRGRAADLFAVSARTVEGYAPPHDERVALVDAWTALERWAAPLVLAGVLLAAARGRGRRHATGDSLLPALAAFVLAVAAVALLPAEAWYYYLDTALVPGCVLLGVAAAAPGRAAAALRLAVVAAAALRAVGLLAWIAHAHASGLVRVNLEWLRLGGGDASALSGRARLPTLAVKERAARAIVSELGIPPEIIRSRVHGAGFADLDTDNGFFFARAARRTEGGRAAPAEREAVVLYAGETPDEWVAGFAPPLRAGPLAIHPYEPVIRRDAARLSSCAGAPLPAPAASDPREYGFGQPALPAWPCAPGDVEIEVPLAPLPAGATVRAFARVQGAARVLSFESAPPGGVVASPSPGAGAGALLPRDARRLVLRLRIDGPTDLDLYELHGAARSRP